MSSSGETHGKILDSAFSCAERTADFTLTEVAREAGLSRQAVYLHFPDRAGLLAALLARAADEQTSAGIDAAPSARAALATLAGQLAQTYPRAWPVVRALGGDVGNNDLIAACRKLAERFRSEGALAPHLSPQAATDLLATLLSLAVWKELVIGRGWDSARYKSHISFLAAGAVTH